MMNLLPPEVQKKYRKILNDGDVSFLRDEIYATPHDFIFSGYVHTNDPHNKPTKRLFPDKEYIRDLVTLLHECDRLVIEKSRQVMVTNTVVPFLYYYAAVHPGSQIFIRAERREQAQSILSRAKFLHLNLAEWLRPKLKKPLDAQHRVILEFDNGSFIMAMAEGAHKIRSYTPSVVYDDEAAFWKDFEESYAAVLPAIEGGGRYIASSTAFPGQYESLVMDRM